MGKLFKGFKMKVLSITVGLMLVGVSVFAGAKFSDVEPSQWFYEYVMSASEMGIVDGFKDGTFKPNRDVTRAELTKVMVDYDKKVVETVLKMSTDEQKTINAVAKTIPSTVEVRSDVGTGSGFFVKSNYVMTNQHVVGNSKQVVIVTANGENLTGTIIVANKGKDIALVKVDKNFSFLSFANDIIVGQTAIVIGHPLGLPNSVTKGIVSKLGVMNVREVEMFQLDTAINYGNSGGAIIDTNGQVIGMTTAKYVGEGIEGLGLGINGSELNKFIQENLK